MEYKVLQNVTEKDYHWILENESVITCFQPIVSGSENRTVIVEALSRGLTSDRELVNPELLFYMGRRTTTAADLDRLCLRKAFERFGRIQKDDRDLLLAVNLEPTILSIDTSAEEITDMAIKAGLSPASIILEILESDINSIEVLKSSIDAFKKSGFLIALTGTGKTLSNLERVVILQPDIIKIDSALVRNIENDIYKKEIVQAINSISHQVGAVVIVEGVETEDEAVTSLEYGSDLLQGFLILHPQETEELYVLQAADAVPVASGFRNRTLQMVKNRHLNFTRYDTVMSQFILELSAMPNHGFHKYLHTAVNRQAVIDCVYILDENGIQVGDCVFSDDFSPKSRLFHVSSAGFDHSYKSYFFHFSTGLHKYTTKKYISRNSGHLCTTIALPFSDGNNIPYILCCDIIEE